MMRMNLRIIQKMIRKKRRKIKMMVRKKPLLPQLLNLRVKVMINQRKQMARMVL